MDTVEKIVVKKITRPTLLANYFLYYAGLFVIWHSIYGIGVSLVDNTSTKEYYIIEGFIMGVLSIATGEAVVNGKKVFSDRRDT